MGSGIVIFQYTHNLSYLVFAALGASLGNYILLTIEIRRQNGKDNPLKVLQNMIKFIICIFAVKNKREIEK